MTMTVEIVRLKASRRATWVTGLDLAALRERANVADEGFQLLTLGRKRGCA